MLCAEFYWICYQRIWQHINVAQQYDCASYDWAITYSDTETCGTIVGYFQEEIKKAADNTRLIKIIPSSKADKDVQTVMATWSLNVGIVK